MACDSTRLSRCSLCGKSGTGMIKCRSCEAVWYCSESCRMTDWNQTGALINYSHRIWCERFKIYMDFGADMAKLPFTFMNETSDPDFNVEQFLRAQGVYQQGAWKVEEMGVMQQQTSERQESQPDEDCIVLPVESVTLENPPSPSPGKLTDWAGYYRLRGFSLDSPVAAILHWPLTLYYVITHSLPTHYPLWKESLLDNYLYIDVIGVSLETELIPLFKEVSYLLPTYRISIHMYGPGISKSEDGGTFSEGGLEVRVVRGLYHKVAPPHRKPCLALAYHVGVYVFKTWKKTLEKLKAEKVPTFFTEYGHRTYEEGRRALAEMDIGCSMSEPMLNHFRSPLRINQEETLLPWYRNAILFHLIFS
ncbi:ZMY15-like protein [Mya arenaria]|uniref:ZMY15-like protein n=1 Tax=Mya arenaria TaxID=6604 RepID=A0ABY7DW15_MYAAR|nr:zinc finger MYND domain-containing protein 15-like [Mya arenaria]XP_052795419.1 zinc finger MYND domain-containing protein 15-like [Mya arenaria]WAR00891.1 ZMY15-like protein [Mya arenaria]